MEVHWRIIPNLGFKFRSKFFPRIVVAVHAGASSELFIVQWARAEGSSPGRVEGSSRAILATARPSCFFVLVYFLAIYCKLSEMKTLLFVTTG